MTLIDAAVALADTLRQENDALERHDLPAAAALLARKQSAAEAFAEAARGEVPASMHTLARDLSALADTNRRLLERAMAVQRQVIGLVARSAAMPAMPGAGRYNRTGAQVTASYGHALVSRA